MHLVVFDTSRFSLRVIDNGPRADRPQFTNLADAMKRSDCVAGINGGFFDPQHFTPSGLMIANGRTVSRFDPQGWQKGVLVVGNDGVSLLEPNAFIKHDQPTEGLQSGPWLLHSGRIDATQKEDSQSARRVFVATGKSGLCAIGFSTPVTFYQLAEILVSEPVSKSVEFSEALALDGASSAGFWCSVGGQLTSDPELTTVRNFVAVAPVRSDGNAPQTNRVAIILITALIAVASIWASRRRRASQLP